MRTWNFISCLVFGLALAACNNDVPLGDEPGDGGIGGSAGAGGGNVAGAAGDAGNGQAGSAGGTGTECKADGECAQIEICMLCPGGASVCPTAKCEAGKCVMQQPDCPKAECASDGDCAVPMGPCQVCPDQSTSCPSAACIEGVCSVSMPGCGAWAPCADKKCGETCSLCDPTDPNCAMPDVEMFCDAKGGCAVQYPQCGIAQCASDADCVSIMAPCTLCPDGTEACPSTACVNGVCESAMPGCKGFSPCDGKKCGETCSPCDPADPNCVAPGVMMYCDAAGTCGMAFPTCQQQCASDADCPQMGMPCITCPDNSQACPTSACIEGQCAYAVPGCKGGYNSCAGKSCGALCTVCDPADPTCVETGIVKFCTAEGTCGPLMPSCK